MTGKKPAYPRKLQRGDIRDEFDSGSRELDDWIQRNAFLDQRANSATTYVSCVGQLVIGYYSITVGAVAKQSAPTVIAKGASPEIPCILLTRLAVDRNYQGKGFGIGLLKDALERSALISNAVGAAAVLIHARDTQAKAFFVSQLDFQASPLDQLQLMIPMKEVFSRFSIKQT